MTSMTWRLRGPLFGISLLCAFLSAEHYPFCKSRRNEAPLVLGQMAVPGSSSSFFSKMMMQLHDAERTSILRESNACPSCKILSDKCDDETVAYLCDPGFEYSKGARHLHADFPNVVKRISKMHKKSKNVHVVTFLRPVAEWVSKVYSLREVWDPHFGELVHPHSPYARKGLMQLTAPEWIDGAYWRWNLLTRLLAVEGTKSLLISSPPWTLEEAQEANRLGRASPLFQQARQRLFSLPFFGIFEKTGNMTLPSYQLFFHTYCLRSEEFFDEKSLHLHYLHDTGHEVTVAVKRTNVLDLALLEDARVELERRVRAMNAEKARGVVCNYKNTGCEVYQ